MLLEAQCPAQCLTPSASRWERKAKAEHQELRFSLGCSCFTPVSPPPLSYHYALLAFGTTGVSAEACCANAVQMQILLEYTFASRFVFLAVT